MPGKAILRAFLILALIVTAHSIKPFSIKSITEHLLFSTRSFRFVLPVGLRDKFDHANYLAINLSKSLFEAGEGIQNFAKDMVPDFSLVAIKAQPLDEVNKSATRQRPCPKKSAPAKRVVKPEKNVSPDLPSLVASVNSDEIMPVELPAVPSVKMIPVLAPIYRPCPTKLFPARNIAVAPVRSVELVIAFRKVDCEKREVARGPLIALIESLDVKRAIWITEKRKIEKSEKIGIGLSECEERKTEVEAGEIHIEVAEPEEESMMFQESEETKLNPLSIPFDECSKDL